MQKMRKKKRFVGIFGGFLCIFYENTQILAALGIVQTCFALFSLAQWFIEKARPTCLIAGSHGGSGYAERYMVDGHPLPWCSIGLPGLGMGDFICHYIFIRNSS